MICSIDDGIVVVSQIGRCTVKIVVGLALRERLGENGTRELTEFAKRHSDEVRSDVMDVCDTQVAGLSSEIADRFAGVDTKLSELSKTIDDLKIDLIGRLADMRVELLRWTFVFWVGQFAAMFAVLAAFEAWRG